MRIGVVGAGYLGAVHAACMTALGHDVVVLEIDPARVEALASGQAPFFEPGLDELLVDSLATGRLLFTTDPTAVADCVVIFLCVGTPQQTGSHAADMTHVLSAVTTIAPLLENPTLIVGKSTVPVGSAPQLAELLVSLAPVGTKARLMWNPEFLREGFAIADTLHPDRFVYGVFDDVAPRDTEHPDVRMLDRVYATSLATGTPRLITDPATAELVKVSANAFLATKISFINAIAEVCEVTGGDVVTLAEAIGLDDRIGRKFLGAGIGFGGGCLPKDIRAFMARSGEVGATDALLFLREVDAINRRRRSRTVDLAREAVGGRLKDKKVAVLGAAFKPNSDDVRDSPALDIAFSCYREGAEVIVHDPRATGPANRVRPELAYTTSLADALVNADVVLHLTEWAEYQALDPAAVIDKVNSPVVIDGRNALDPQLWREAGWTFRSLGRTFE